MKRAYLVESDSDILSKTSPPAEGQSAPRFSLDSPIDDEGSNLSIGQRSLVSLARALVNDTKILILDEATGKSDIYPGSGYILIDFYVASVDYETDSKIQYTIANEFKERTILCIARKS